MMLRACVCAAAGSLAMASVVMAGQARVVTRYSAGSTVPKVLRANTDSTRLVKVVQRQVVQPAAVVSAALSDQPVHAHLVEVQVGHTEIFIDPRVDHLRQSPHTTMQRSFITAALQRHHRETRSHATTVHGRQARPMKRMIRPRMIILRPDYLDNRPQAKPKKGPIPTVPAAPNEKKLQKGASKLMAHASTGEH